MHLAFPLRTIPDILGTRARLLTLLLPGSLPSIVSASSYYARTYAHLTDAHGTTADPIISTHLLMALQILCLHFLAALNFHHPVWSWA
jgi:hypothetical protein